MPIAMILAAGRGERMRPLTDHAPKPLLEVGGKPLIVWQIERLVAAGFADIVINHAWLGAQIEQVLGDGGHFGARIAYSAEGEPLETAGGIAKALPSLRAGRERAFLCVAADIYTDYDYASLLPRLDALEGLEEPGMHLVMTDNPAFHAGGDFALEPDGGLRADGERKLTFSSIGLYDTRMFAGLSAGRFAPMRPFYDAAIAAGRASGEYFNGVWHNVGTPQQLRQLDAQLRAVPG
ncbi:N-acetylmuramate alpha-1-phosphate uridylyltransferase MurU [Chromobacterium sp. Beijing]|uniref:N-acetylmuramate alpha-1-phosphate uridylyltransferase MurU n=1 Tax=Chromobacterium sp. Beijing TaxID=2735795 RepID=UPI001F258CC1|nr:nucleotidyltransferase family protein [Chromobacterium sp. Beijing]